MPVAALPSLPQVVARLSHRPAIPFSLNALYVLLTPFLPSPASPVPPASTWDSVYAYYGPGTQAVWFEAAGEPDTWAVILTRQLEPGLVKVHSALSDPSPTSSSRQALFTDVMAHLKATHAGSTVSFGGVPDGLQPTFDGFVVGDKGVPSRSYRVQKTLDDALAEHPSGKVLDETKFARGSLTWEEVPEALATFKSSYAPAAFEKLLHFTSCIRDLSTPAQKPISWCLVYEDLSIAALCTIPGYRGASLAHHTVTHLASLLATAFAQLPADLRQALPGDGPSTTANGPAWLVADWNEGNPAGEGFFKHEGFEKLDEAVRWSRGKM